MLPVITCTVEQSFIAFYDDKAAPPYTFKKRKKNCISGVRADKKQDRKIKISKNIFHKAIDAISFDQISFFNFCFPKILRAVFSITVISAYYNKK